MSDLTVGSRPGRLVHRLDAKGALQLLPSHARELLLHFPAVLLCCKIGLGCGPMQADAHAIIHPASHSYLLTSIDVYGNVVRSSNL